MTMTLPAVLEPYSDYILPILEQLIAWAIDPAAWSQLVVLLVAYAMAVLIHRTITARVTSLLQFIGTKIPKLADLCALVARLWPVAVYLLAFVFTGIGEAALTALFESAQITAFGKRLFLFLAVRAVARAELTTGILLPVSKFVIIPLAALYALGLFDELILLMSETTVPVLNASILWVVQFVIFAGIAFAAGRWSNDQPAQFIEQQPMRPAVKQLSSKASEILIFGAAFLILMSVMDVSLDSLVVLGGAVGVGLGFGLQKIASNFISGVILLLEGQATVGDYVALDNGEEGRIVKTTARAMILETFDGRWIVVPNEDFITTRVVNFSDQGSANRFEVPFSVYYDTDINKVPDIIEAAVSKHPSVLQAPFPPDCELRNFGDSGVDFAVEFWVNGLDDGPNKFTSDVRFMIWNALKEHNIQIPYPHRVIEMKHAANQ